MKLYRYFALAVSAVLAFAACEEENHELNDQNKGKTKPVVEISSVAAKNDALAFDLAASGADVMSYGYVVYEGKGNEAPSAYDIVTDAVADAFDSNVYDFLDADKTTVNVEVEPQGEYEIFAAAITKTGLLSEVISKTVDVADDIAPELEDYDYEDNSAVMYLLFSEGVEYVKEKEIVATLYAGVGYVNSSKTTVYPYADPSMKMGTAKGKVSVDGEVVMIDFGEQVTGTLYSVDVPAGAFVDYAGNACEATTSVVSYDKATDSNVFDGLIALVKASTFSVEPAAEIPTSLLIDEFDQFFNFKSAQYLYGGSSTPAAVATFVLEEKGSTNTRKVELVAGKHLGVTSLNTIGVKIPVEPKAGEKVTVEVPAGIFKDVYGNTNEAFSFGPILFTAKPLEVHVSVDAEYNKAQVSVTPDADDLPYMVWVAPKTVFDKFADDAAVLAYDKAYIQSVADKNSVTFETVYNAWVYTGAAVEEFSGLEPETAYVAYAYGVDAEYNALTVVDKKEFTTPANPWKLLGVGQYTDPFTCGLYGISPAAVCPANVYESKTTPGVYAVESPYIYVACAAFGVTPEVMAKYQGTYWDESMIVVDASNPDAVVIPQVELGICLNSDDGWMVGTSMYQGAPFSVGKLADGVITNTNVKGMLAGFILKDGSFDGWYYGNTKGEFRLELPKAAPAAVAPASVKVKDINARKVSKILPDLKKDFYSEFKSRL